MNAPTNSPEGLEEIVADVEDILAHRMELALLGGWTPWKEYMLRGRHRGLHRSVGQKIEVRFQYPGAVFMNVEVRFEMKDGWIQLYPEANEWWFPGLEDEAEARASREANDKPLRPY